MLLQLPTSLKYPVTITALLKNPNEEVTQQSPLVRYQYKTWVLEDDELTGETKKTYKWFTGNWECPIDGTLKKWYIREGEVYTKGNVDMVEIEEPCSHPVQFEGMCGYCGKDMTM